jgi:hypothetical protein
MMLGQEGAYFKMLEVTLLSTKDKKQWLEILSRFDLQDPHYLPEYLEIYEKEDNRESFTHFGGQGMLFIYGDSRNFIIYPFFKRSISYLPFSDNSVKDLYDVVSPYGYGGPLVQVEDETISEELWTGFYKRFDDFCKESNIVSEFCRLHPIFDNHKPVGNFSQGITQRMGQIVYVDLRRSEEEILAGMSMDHRQGTRKALRNPDLSFELNAEENYTECLFNIYTQTMQRAKALKKYFFSQSFFNAAVQLLGEHLSLPHVTYQGDIIAGMLLLKYGELAYFWLSGSKSSYLRLYPNNLLLYSSFLQSKKEGLKYFVLGGGLTAESLFTFKAGFSKLTKDFYVYKRIHHKREYERLVELRGKYSRQISGDFFPQYRLP